MTVGLLGATGYTGRLVATELLRRKVSCRLGGRDLDRLGNLPAPGDTERMVVDVSDPTGLDHFLAGIDAVISCVGPFAALGLPVVEAAARSGVAYVDSTGEPAFMAEVYRRFGHAEDGSVSTPLVPACGFDYVPGDLAAAVATSDLGPEPVRRVLVAYQISGLVPSRGTARSALGAIAGVSLAPRVRQVPFPDGDRPAIDVPWGETLTIPRWLPAAEVVTCVTLAGTVGQLGSAAAGFGRSLGDSPAAAAGRRAVEVALRPALGAAVAISRRAAPLLSRLLDRMPEGPQEGRRAQTSFTVVVIATGEGGRERGVACEGSDIYGLTARLLVEAALRAGGAGALTPAQALDPEPFLNAVSEGGTACGGPGSLTWRRFEPRS
jgi:short subunit dehydrogenase-like uncharacterized protein